mmetsp:Transcript_6131/g.9082  ORF Transcript_6131/g.9082 Transcript_6131/m.9082 type:complete len:229 (-) Transcript_6131:22-708(-)
MGIKKYIWETPEVSVYSGKHPKALKVVRAISLVLMALVFLITFPFEPETYFLALTCWGITICLVYYFLVIVALFWKPLDRYSYVFFEISWGIEWVITLYYWCLIAGLNGVGDIFADLTQHTLPMVLLIVDYSLNNILILRAHYFIVTMVFLAYILLVNMPYTLAQDEEIYPGINYENAFTYISFLICLVIAFVSLELGRYIKKRSKTSDERQLESNPQVERTPDVGKA